MREINIEQTIARNGLRHAKAIIEEADMIRKGYAMYVRLCEAGFTENEINYNSASVCYSITVHLSEARLALARRTFGKLKMLYKSVESEAENTIRISLAVDTQPEGETPVRFEYVRSLDDSDKKPGKCRIITVTRNETQLVCER